MPTCGHAVYGCVCVTMAEASGCDIDAMAHKPQSIYH